MNPEQFFTSTQKYLTSFFKDGKRISSDFELLNELYITVAGTDCPKQPQPSLLSSENMVLIDLNLNVDEKYISESFLWDSETTSAGKINSFIDNFLDDIIYEHGIQVQGHNLADLKEQCTIQLRAQTLYKSLLKKYSNILLNFSTMEVSQDIKEYLVEIGLKLNNENGETFYEDSFEWDILNDQNNVEDFCKQLMEDEQIPSKYFSELCYKIRTQINNELQWKFTLLVKTFRSIHRDRESPKLNTQTMTQLKKNIIYTMDATLTSNPQKQAPLPSVVLNNSDLFSLLCRNVDILPEDFQEMVMGKQVKEKDPSKGIPKKTAEELLSKKGCRVADNRYVGNFASNYRMHRIWRKELQQ